MAELIVEPVKSRLCCVHMCCEPVLQIITASFSALTVLVRSFDP